MKNLPPLRASIWMVLFVLVYARQVSVLLGNNIFGTSWLAIPGVFVWLLLVAGLFGLLHPLSIEWQKWKRSLIELVIVVMMFAQLMYVFVHGSWQGVDTGYKRFVLLTIVGLHIAFLVIVRDKLYFFRTRVILPLGSLVQAGLTNFALLTTVSFSLLAAGAWQTYPLDCTMIYKGLERSVMYIQHHTDRGSMLGTGVYATLDDVADASVGEVLGVDESEVNMLSLVAKEQQESLEASEETGLMLAIIRLKLFMLDQVTEKGLINQDICQVIIGHIEEKSQSALFNYSVATLLFFLLYPLVRLLLMSVSVFMRCILQALQVLGVYTWATETKEVEVIE